MGTGLLPVCIAIMDASVDMNMLAFVSWCISAKLILTNI